MNKSINKSFALGSLIVLMGIGTASPNVVNAEPTINPGLGTSTPSESSTTPSVPTTLPATPAAPQIEVLSNGSEPRQPLRYRITSNVTQTTRIQMETDVAVALRGEPAPNMAVPAIEMGMEVKATPINEQGDTRVEFRYTTVTVAESATVPPEVMRMIRSQLQPLMGIQGSYVINSRGQVLESNVALPATSDPLTQMVYQQINSSLMQSTSDPFPAEPLGEGASWRVSTATPGSPIPLNGVATYTVNEIDGDNLVLATTVTAQSDSQSLEQTTPFDLPGNALPPGFKINLRSLNVESSGTVALQLDQIMPTESTILTTANMAFDLTLPGDRQFPMTMQSRVTMTMGSD